MVAIRDIDEFIQAGRIATSDYWPRIWARLLREMDSLNRAAVEIQIPLRGKGYRQRQEKITALSLQVNYMETTIFPRIKEEIASASRLLSRANTWLGRGPKDYRRHDIAALIPGLAKIASAEGDWQAYARRVGVIKRFIGANLSAINARRTI